MPRSRSGRVVPASLDPPDTGSGLALVVLGLVLGPAGALAVVAWFAWVTLRLLAGG